jgi:hypothetical protein
VHTSLPDDDEKRPPRTVQIATPAPGDPHTVKDELNAAISCNMAYILWAIQIHGI